MKNVLKSLAPLFGIALLLTACAGNRSATTPPTASAARPDIAQDSEPAPVLKAPEPAPEPRPRSRPSFDAKQFIGKDATAVQRTLGHPSLKQQETFAEVWHYVSGPCVLHLYFYRPEGSRPDAKLKVEQALVETRPGPWGENLNPVGICALEFSGRGPATASPPAPAPAQNKRR